MSNGNGEYFPFDNRPQMLLAVALLFPEPSTNRKIKDFAVKASCPWIKPGFGFKNIEDFHKRLRQLWESDGRRWIEKSLKGNGNVKVYIRDDILEVLKTLVGDTRLANHMRWAPEKVFDGSGSVRLYSELWTTNWWWRMQVHPSLRTSN